ncbi:MAG: AAA family ATPase [Elusimicrobia bacterium]|nr:AAA family ATPase [Elusimicrobiota bacterium]
MQRIAIFGKGGIGKSTLSGNLAAFYAKHGKKVLLVGCDPKHDTTVALTEGRPIKTVVEQSMFMDQAGGDMSKILVRGRLGVDCVEAGGPEPGIGCAGRGISRMIELLEGGGLLRKELHDVAIFDVLGDVVCGGFAAPLRQGFADRVVIVTSEELMSLYAVNNISRAIRNYAANGIALAGLVANLRDPGVDKDAIKRFAAMLGTRVLTFLPRDPLVREAELARSTVVERSPRSEVARKVASLAKDLLAFDRTKAAVPTPLSDEAFHELSRKSFLGAFTSAPAEPAGPVSPRTPDLSRDAWLEAAPEEAQAAPLPSPAELEKALSWQAQLWKNSPGCNDQVWGSPDQWRRFFCDFETRRHARTRLEIQAPVVHVWHQDLECSYATPDYYDTSLPAFFKFPWPKPAEPGGDDGPEGPRQDRGDDSARKGPRGKRGKDPGPREEHVVREAMTNLRDLDIIHGGGRKLDETLRLAVEHAKGRAQAVVVHSTCVPTVIGDDAGAVVQRWQKRSKVPVIYTNPAENNQEVDLGLLLFRKLQAKKPSPESQRGHGVNLVGFPNGKALKELIELLGRSGVEVNTCVLPSLHPDAARRYLDARVQVLYPNGAYEDAYKEFFRPLAIRTVSLDAPYGIEATGKWLAAVAESAGVKSKARPTFEAARKEAAPFWQAGRNEAGKHGLAFVVDGNHIGRLTDSSQMWGIPVMRFLRELGFRVQVLCHGKASKEAASLSFFQTPEELSKLLKEGSFEAVYSEYAFDPRLASAGKAQFSLEHFEMGLMGGARTQASLNLACAWSFYRKYGRYVGGGR